MKLLLHIVGLPHTGLEDRFSWCAYTGKVRRFATMMSKFDDIDVFVYHSGNGDDKGIHPSRYIQVFDEEERVRRFSEFENKAPIFDDTTFFEFNSRTIGAIRTNISSEHQNIICLIAGSAHGMIAAAFPSLPSVEFGVGYAGVMPNTFRCFESYSWMHVVYGSTMGAYQADGRNYDVVIPNYYDVEDFSMQSSNAPEGGYMLYLARTEVRKGVHTAVEVAKATGAKLVVAGNGPRNFNSPGVDIEDVGFVEPEKRRELLAGARALIQPTNFIEPFGGSVIEALLSGVPVLTSDWGAFTETVIEGRDGFRCRTLGEYVDGWGWTSINQKELSIQRREKAIERFSVDVVGKKYHKWLKKIAELYEPGSLGWYKIDK
jgi:glycosyltransferase involved in cell wall biosynthesis